MAVTLYSSISSLDRAAHVQIECEEVAQIEAKREVAVRTFLQFCAGTLVLIIAPCVQWWSAPHVNKRKFIQHALMSIM